MKYEDFKNILNEQIVKSSKVELLEHIFEYKNSNIIYNNIDYTKNYLLNLLIELQNSNFCNAFKKIFKKYFSELGYQNLDKVIENNNENRREYLDLDQLFTDKKYIYFVEQKVRDDHDSTKKRGQMQNFEDKIISLLKMYNETQIKSYTYFIDPSLIKNKNFYIDEIKKIEEDYNVSSKLCYGEEFWEDIGHGEVWEELLLYLKKWKEEIPDMPSINFDENVEDNFEEIKNIKTSIYRKLFSNIDICKEILPILFPQNKTLKLLKDYFSELGMENTIYKKLAEKIEDILV